MSKVKREVECLNRLQDMTGQLEDILGFLKQENLVDDNQLRSVKLSADHPKEVRNILQELKSKQKIQLLQYTWSVLPVENISIMIITDRNQKEFIFHGG